MNANKVTVAMLKAAGFKLVDGDGVWFDEPENEEILIIEFDTVDHWNEDSQVDKEWIIKSLAPRVNDDGTQPVGDDCTVDCVLYGGTKRTKKAGDIFWTLGEEWSIVTWIPNLPSILEKQMNIYKSALELTERDIEDAFIQQENAAVERELSESDDWKYNNDVVFDIDCAGVFIGLVPEDNDKAIIYQPDFNRTHIVKVWGLSAPLTPEQLAAKEREEFIREIIKVVYPHWNGLGGIENDYGELWGRIYDAGYRK